MLAHLKTQKTHFLKIPEWADFDLLESNCRHIFLHKNQKIYHSQFFSLDACSSPMCTRVRDAGASGRECSALAGRHYLPPRQAGFTSFSTKKSNCNFLEDVASPHCAKTSLSSTLRIISRRRTGRLA